MAKVETKSIDDILPDPNNANKHTQRGHQIVENSIRRRGVGRGILAAGKNTDKPVIMAGNLTAEKARDAGIDEVVIVHTTGNQLVVTVRDDLDPTSPEAIALGIEDNESGKQSYNPDIDLLAAMSAGDNGVLSALKNEDKIFGGMLEGMIPAGSEEPAEPRKTLAERFGVPPFSVLNARGGVWQDRKRAWIELGIQSELGRGDSPSTSARSDEPSYRPIRRQPTAAPGGSLRDATTLENGKTVRGDGKGKRLTWVVGDKNKGELDDTSRKNLAAGRKSKTLGAIAPNEGGENGILARTGKYSNNGLLGNSKQARSHYKEPATSYSSQARLTALQKTGNSSAVVYGTAGNVSEQTGTSIFDPVLCELVYRWFMPQGGGRILDPFAGGSVRGIVASMLGKDYTGVDLSERQIEANRVQADNLTSNNKPVWIVGDSQNVDTLAAGEYDFVFSCPPYANLEVYSDDPKDLSRMDYADFIAAYKNIIIKSVAMLKDNRFACFVVGDVRDNEGFYRNFPAHTIDAFQEAGMILYNEAILVTAVGSLPIRVGRQFEGYRKLGKTHQNVLVFYKGNPKAIKDFGVVEFGELEGADEIPD